MYAWYSRAGAESRGSVLGRHRLGVRIARESGVVGGARLEHAPGPRQANLLDDRSRLAQRRGSRLGVAHDLGIDLEVPEVHRERDPPTLDAAGMEGEIELVRDRGRIVSVLARHDVQHERRICDGAGHRAVCEVRVEVSPVRRSARARGRA